MTTDLIGNALTAPEQELLAAYHTVKSLVQRELPPCATANAKVALAALAVAVTDLGIEYEHLTDFGC